MMKEVLFWSRLSDTEISHIKDIEKDEVEDFSVLKSKIYSERKR